MRIPHNPAIVILALAALGIAAAFPSGPAAAQSEAQATPYDGKLNELAERLGAIHYLRNLCSEPDNRMRTQMTRLLDVEQPEPPRRAKLIASFNRGYRTFNSVYATCTPQARVIVDDYLQQARTLSRELVNTYGRQ